MDLALYFRVLWRFRRIVFVGMALAIALAFLSFAKVSLAHGKPSLAYRGKEQWASFSRIFVTMPGFEWGSTVPGQTADKVTQQRSEEDRLTSIAIIYSSLMTSDPVQQIMRKAGPVHGQVLAAPLPVMEGSDQLLPIISVEGISDTMAGAESISKRATGALVQYVKGQQNATRTPSDDRIVLNVVNRASYTKLLAGRPKTLPIVVFMTVMLAVVGLVFILENMNPQVRALAGGSGEGGVPVIDTSRRSA
jgi:hypothetical protein